MAANDFDMVVERMHEALGEFVKGDPEPLKSMFSQQDDISLANPFGLPVRGWKRAAETMERAASFYRDGQITEFEYVARHVTSGLACLVEVERYTARVGRSKDRSSVALRVTSIFRPEGGSWKIIHRHADPIATSRPAESVILE